MRNRLQTGDTSWNNAQRLGVGELAFDSETKALRVHTGKLLGGLALLGNRAYTPTNGPGPEALLYGDSTQGFYGVASDSDVITPSALATAVGYSEGIELSETVDWLKFSLDEKTLFIAKTPLRYTVSWNALNAAGLAYGGDDGARITIGSDVFVVRLPKGADTDPTNVTLSQRNPAGVLNSEWNRTLVKLVNDWGGYTSVDLKATTGNGRYSYCQEWPTERAQTSSRVLRGGGDGGVEWFAGSTSITNPYSTFGWRPVLELVQ